MSPAASRAFCTCIWCSWIPRSTQRSIWPATSMWIPRGARNPWANMAPTSPICSGFVVVNIGLPDWAASARTPAICSWYEERSCWLFARDSAAAFSSSVAAAMS